MSLINRLNRFAYDIVFAEIIASKVAKIGFRREIVSAVSLTQLKFGKKIL
jgi:hypothetical protein